METYPVQVHVRVRARDIGPSELVDPSQVLVYLQEARRAYVGALNADSEDFRLRIIEVVLTIEHPIAVDDELAVRARVDELASQWFRMSYMIRNRLTREIVARGSTTQMLVDDEGRDRLIPDVLRRRVVALEGRPFPLPS